MNKISILFIYFCLFYFSSKAQNLVPNPSFEQLSFCPFNYNQVTLATGWEQSLNNNTPQYHTEYLNSCSSFPNFQTPANTWGFQVPFQGQAYMAINTMAPSVFTDYRENIYIQLSSPLVIGQQYKVKFHASHTDNSKYVTNNLGVKFSTTTNFPIDNISQVYASSIISTNTGWDTIQGIFTADSAYSYIAIGNFFTDANTTRAMNYPSAAYALDGYYVDDVSVICVAPTITISGNSTICAGDSTKLEVHGGNSYLWNTGSSDSVIYVKPNTATLYTVVSALGSCISNPDSILMNVNQAPTISLTGDTISCNATAVQLIAISPTAQAIHWSAGIVSTNDTVSILGVFPAFISAYAFDGACSSKVDSIWVDTLSTPSINVSYPMVNCIGDTIPFSAITNASTLLWNFGHSASGAANTSSLFNPSHIYMSSGNFPISLVAQNSCGSAAFNSQVTIQNGPQAFLPKDTIICQGQNIAIPASGGTSYLWSGAFQSTAASISVSPLVPSYYIVKAKNGGCYGLPDTIKVTPISKPILVLSGPDSLCAGDQNVLTVSGAASYYWNGASGVSSASFAISPLVTSTYSVVGAIGGCISDTSFWKVIVANSSKSDFSFSIDTCTGDIFFNDQSHFANSYKWIFGDGSESQLRNPIHHFTSSGIFLTTLVINPGRACSDTLSESIAIEIELENFLIIPNAFTPNGDGLNDFFRIKSPNNCNYLQLEIFNRWGQLIYQTAGFQVEWKGDFMGRTVPEGVYAYRLLLNKTEKSGTVLVIR